MKKKDTGKRFFVGKTWSINARNSGLKKNTEKKDLEGPLQHLSRFGVFVTSNWIKKTCGVSGQEVGGCLRWGEPPNFN